MESLNKEVEVKEKASVIGGGGRRGEGSNKFLWGSGGN